MNTTNNNEPGHLLIVSITPYFLEKSGVWFKQNLQKILGARDSQSFFEDNTIFLEKDHSYQFSLFLRKLDEMGYERVLKVTDPGEFSQRGGIIDVFNKPKQCDKARFFGKRSRFYKRIIRCENW